MTPQIVLDALARSVAEPCGICLGKSGHPAIEGDGPPRCYPCVLRIGRVVRDPLSAPTALLVALDAASGDVVELKACAAHRGACWTWIADWPDVDKAS